MVLFLVPMLNSCHRHMHCAPVSWSNQWWLVQVLPTEFLPISSFAQLGSGLSHSFITVISLCLLVLTEIWAAVHIWDSHSDDGYTSQFIHWQISSDYTSHDAKKKSTNHFSPDFAISLEQPCRKLRRKGQYVYTAETIFGACLSQFCTWNCFLYLSKLPCTAMYFRTSLSLLFQSSNVWNKLLFLWPPHKSLLSFLLEMASHQLCFQSNAL